MERIFDGYIRGEFRGWLGDTIVETDDGKRWQQAEYRYDYNYNYGPAATIDVGEAGCVMTVEDMEPIAVREVQPK